MIAAGASQACIWVARGWVRSLFFVVFSYASTAALKMDWKFEEEEEEEDTGTDWDMVLIGRVSVQRATGR
jgi:hypothetical protein